MLRIPPALGWLRDTPKLQRDHCVGTHPLVGRGGRGGADQILALQEVPVVGRASFEGQRRGNVGAVGAGHPIELQICKKNNPG